MLMGNGTGSEAATSIFSINLYQHLGFHGLSGYSLALGNLNKRFLFAIYAIFILVLLYRLKYIVQSSILSQIFDFGLGEEVR